MKKAKVIPLSEKKKAQLERSLTLSSEERILYLFDLIKLSMQFNPTPKIHDHQQEVIVLKRK
jgi:hypothetical protein